jgi:HEAT repeat protein
MSSFESRRVAGLKRRRDVAGLIEALQTGGERDRRAAANALVTIPDPRAVDPLIEALGADEFQDSRPDSDLRRIVGPLNSALGDQQPSVRAAAATALGRLRDPGSVEPLVAALDDDNAAVGKTAALVLRGFDDDRARAALAARQSG